MLDASSLCSATSVHPFDRRFGWWGWEWWQTGHGEQKLVRGVVEVQVGVDGTVGSGEEDGGAARVVNGDIGFEASAATCLFDDVRRVVGWQNVNPAETYAGCVASVIESLFPDEIGGKDVDGLRGRVLCGDGSATRLEQVLEPDRHIGRGGVEAGASNSGLGGGAGSFLAGADEQMTALRSVGKERCVVHVKWIESALSKKGCILLVRGRLEGVAEQVKGNVRIEAAVPGMLRRRWFGNQRQRVR
jgi:hypothetical protein